MRIQIELPPDDARELRSFMEKAGIDTYKDLFLDAVTILNWAIQEVQRGRIIASFDERTGQYKELAMPIFQRAANRSRPKDEKSEECAAGHTRK